MLVVNLIVISFCKTIYFVTLACFSVILIYPHSLFSYFIFSYFTLYDFYFINYDCCTAFPLRPPRLAFAICGRRWQNDAESSIVCVLLLIPSFNVFSDYFYVSLNLVAVPTVKVNFDEICDTALSWYAY